MDMQEEELKDKAAKIDYAEQCLTTLKLELKVRFNVSHYRELLLCYFNYIII